ncbi:MAG: M3 family oligoendopeptidase [Deltaproteobacteria bacterium]|nr:M3 family oligoendopeptidase [Deltaproteobacteria bacterium]
MEKNKPEVILWDLSDLYSNPADPQIAADSEWLKRRISDFSSYRGKVAELGPEQLLEAVRMLEEIYERAEKLLAYAYLEFSTRTLDAGASAFFQSMKEFSSQIRRDTLFFRLEWTKIEDGPAEALTKSAALSKYAHYLASLRRYRPHLLSEPEERILAEKSPAGSSAWEALFDKMLGRLRFGEKEKTQSEVLAGLYSADREERKRAAAELSDGLQTLLLPLTHIFNTVLLDKSIDDRLREYPHWLSARNLDNEIGDATVSALVSAVCSRYDLVERYYFLKKKLLGYDELFDYDRYAPVWAQTGAGISWEEAREIVLTSFEDFSFEAAKIARLFFEKQWIHASLLPGKRSGAYSHPLIPSAHPYVFLNFTGSRRDVMTLAHELGHAVHQYLARKQGLFNCNTPLTTAESASVFAETLVFRSLLKRTDSKEERLGLICSRIEDTFATVFRQVAMHRFEERVHNARRTRGELDQEFIGSAWMQTQAAMFGNSVRLLDHYKTWWSYIPHFVHSPGYVYAYAFGQLMTAALYEQYLREGPDFVPAYLEFLESGGKAEPCELLRPLGVDPTDGGFWERGLKIVEGLIDEAEEEASL